ncbi:Prefoldin subunit-domain-containing protein [Gorgonomyces haynaldii]|nr:Prefoldin subunit-domain-containing protein [Gorgonomyces haynaldii]
MTSVASVKLLDQQEEQDVAVSWEDQQNINQFSKLNMNQESLNEILEEKKKELEYLDDLQQEMELMDETVKYRVGDCFVTMDLETAQENVEKEHTLLKKEIGALEDKIQDIQTKMSGLKAVLYGKFGSSINLEK